MPNQNPERDINKLVQRALVPKGFRPRTDEQIAQMMDTIGGLPLDSEKLDRMLKKINGEIPLGPPVSRAIPYNEPPCTEVEQGLAALHRSRGSSLSPEIQRKIEEAEKRAAKECSEDQIDAQ